MERPFIMGENGRKEGLYDESTQLDIIEENNLILKSSSSSSNHHDLTKNLKRLAQDRYVNLEKHHILLIMNLSYLFWDMIM